MPSATKTEDKKKTRSTTQRYFAELSEYDANTKTSKVEILRAGKWDGMKGQFEITADTLLDFVKSFQKKTYGSDLQVNFGHERWAEAAGWFKDVSTDGNTLFANVEWTKLGLDALENKIYRYFSSEIAFQYFDDESGKTTPNVLLGGALTNIPYIRGLAPVMFSDGLEEKILNEDSMPNKKGYNRFDEEADKKAADDEAKAKADADAAAAEEEAKEGEEEADEKAEEKVEAHDKNVTFSAAEAQAMVNKAVNAAVAGVQRSLSETQKELRQRDAHDKCAEFALADNGKTALGFIAKDLSEVEAFAVSLSDVHARTFFSLLGKMKAVNFKEYGLADDGETEEAKSSMVLGGTEYEIDEASVKLDRATKAYAKENKVSYAEAMLAVEDSVK